MTGVLLVGGRSRRFGAPKALAELDGETLAERGWRLLGEACDERLAVGKQADELPLPFPLVDDGTAIHHPAAGITAALRRARNDVCVVLPVDCPSVRASSLRALAAACADAATPVAGDPLPAAFRRTALPALERCIEAGLPLGSALDGLEVRTVDVDRWELANVNVPADLTAVARREGAINAAVQVAARHGLDATSPRVLEDWNDTIVHLAPQPVVARVGTSSLVADNEEAYARALRVAAHAAQRDGPCARPSAALPPGPHRVHGVVLTFWEYMQAGPSPVDPAAAGEALRAFHAAVADYDGPLPSLDARHERAAGVAARLDRPGPADRRLLVSTLARLRDAFGEQARNERVLHGGAHESNLLWTREGPRWIDLDTVCRGPVEWDLAHLPAEAATAFPESDPVLLGIARDLVSAEVAIWCWHAYGRAPEVDAAAHFHLERVRALSA